MKPVYRLSWCLRCGPTVGPLWFPLPPLQLRPIPATRRTHLKGFVFRADTRRWLARWRHSASGLHYQWRQCCVTHRERTSCFTTLLLFLFQPAAFALSFPPPHLQLCFVTVERCGPVHVFRHHCPPLNTSWIISSFTICCRFFSWLLRSTLGWLLLWTLSPESCVFEVSDRYFSSPHVTCFKLFLSVLKERYTFYMNKHK